MRRAPALFLALALLAIPFAAHAGPPDPVPDDAGAIFDDGRDVGDELVALPGFDLEGLADVFEVRLEERAAHLAELEELRALAPDGLALGELHPSDGASIVDSVDDDGDTFDDDGDSSTSSRTWRAMAVGDSGGPLLILQRWRVVDWSQAWPRTATVWTVHDVGAPSA